MDVTVATCIMGSPRVGSTCINLLMSWRCHAPSRRVTRDQTCDLRISSCLCTLILSVRQKTYIDYSAFVAGEEQHTLDPFVCSTFVESTARDLIILGITDFLLNKKVAVQCQHADVCSTTQHDMASQIVDLGTLNCAIAIVGFLQHSYAVEAVQIPEEDLTVSRCRDQRAEGTGSAKDANGSAVAEEVCS